MRMVTYKNNNQRELLMLQAISWSEDFAIGIDIIDEQHKRLFEYFNEVEHCIKTER